MTPLSWLLLPELEQRIFMLYKIQEVEKHLDAIIIGPAQATSAENLVIAASYPADAATSPARLSVPSFHTPATHDIQLVNQYDVLDLQEFPPPVGNLWLLPPPMIKPWFWSLANFTARL